MEELLSNNRKYLGDDNRILIIIIIINIKMNIWIEMCSRTGSNQSTQEQERTEMASEIQNLTHRKTSIFWETMSVWAKLNRLCCEHVFVCLFVSVVFSMWSEQQLNLSEETRNENSSISVLELLTFWQTISRTGKEKWEVTASILILDRDWSVRMFTSRPAGGSVTHRKLSKLQRRGQRLVQVGVCIVDLISTLVAPLNILKRSFNYFVYFPFLFHFCHVFNLAAWTGNAFCPSSNCRTFLSLRYS